MDSSNEDYRCEDCERFDETEVPADCEAGHGKVAFRHRACSDFVLRTRPMIINESERSEKDDKV
jgi:hypothetical protein